VENLVFDDRYHDLIADEYGLRQIGSGFGFPEGPVMLPDGYLLFSDITNDAIVRFTRPDRTGIFRQPCGGANGNTLDLEGRLVTCEPGTRRITRTEHDGSITTLTDNYQGKRLNATNDVVVKSDGGVYFTDPIFLGDFEDILKPSYMALDFSGVFRISLDGGVSLVTDEIPFPNGLAFSEDESVLYVVNTSDNGIYAFDVNADGSVNNKRLWLDMTYDLPGVGDGMKVDVEGNVYSTGPGGIWVAASNGNPIGIIRTPTVATNLAVYGFDSKMLFITSPPNLYMLRINVPGISVIDRIR